MIRASRSRTAAEVTPTRVRRGKAIGGRALLVAALLACTEGTPSPTGITRVATVTLTAPTQALVIGQTTQLAAVGKDAGGQVLPDLSVEWISDDPLVASVSETGLVTALAPGATGVSARIEDKQASLTVTVRSVGVASIAVSPGGLGLTVGAARQLGAATRDADGNELTDLPVRWTTSNASVVSVSEEGIVTAHAAGFASVTAESESKRRSVDVTVCATTGLYITGIHPAALSPGAPATLAGCNFASSLAGNVVMIDGAAA